jgi:hypothetical protein
MTTEPQLIKTIMVRFLQREVAHHQISDFRTEINIILNGKDDLFHNHVIDNEQNTSIITQKKYPLVQFRSIKTTILDKKSENRQFDTAALFGVGLGFEAIGALIGNIMIQNRFPKLKHIEVDTDETLVSITQSPTRYRLNHWLPLNKVVKHKENIVVDNYASWIAPMTMKERIAFLEGIIAGEIKDFCSAIGYEIPVEKLKVTLFDYKTLGKKPYPTSKNGTLSYEAFDVIYEANILLPEYIGMGKGKSKGFGWQTQTNHHQLIDRQRVFDNQKNKQRDGGKMKQ